LRVTGGGDASAANQTTIIGHIDGVETLLTSIDSSNSRLTSSAGRKTVGSALATTAFQVGGTYNATPPTVADTQEVALQVDATGSLKIAVAKTGAYAPVATATLSNVAASATSVTIIASNASRLRLVIHNDSTSRLRIKFGATASSTSFTYLLESYDTYESSSTNLYTGVIDGIWDTATGSARVTEMV